MTRPTIAGRTLGALALVAIVALAGCQPSCLVSGQLSERERIGPGIGQR